MKINKLYGNIRQFPFMGIAVILLFSNISASAQFAPPVGQAGSTAIKADSSVFVAWADNCELQRGYVDISQPKLGLATYGSDKAAFGIADNGVVSLGDGGSAIIFFTSPIVDGPGYDFAVFENSFTDSFLELAFVEVSSNGIDFVRFPAISNSQSQNQVETFGTLDATFLNNLAGKYRVFYGTPFDLNELQNSDLLDINNIKYLKITDVVGCVQNEFASFDSNNNIINDPWPTPFESSGFDLDAVGIINDQAHLGIEKNGNRNISVYPNPFNDVFHINNMEEDAKISIYDLNSRLVYSTICSENELDISGLNLPKGLLLVSIESHNLLSYKKILHQ